MKRFDYWHFGCETSAATDFLHIQKLRKALRLLQGSLEYLDLLINRDEIRDNHDSIDEDEDKHEIEERDDADDENEEQISEAEIDEKFIGSLPSFGKLTSLTVPYFLLMGPNILLCLSTLLPPSLQHLTFRCMSDCVEGDHECFTSNILELLSEGDEWVPNLKALELMEAREHEGDFESIRMACQDNGIKLDISYNIFYSSPSSISTSESE